MPEGILSIPDQDGLNRCRSRRVHSSDLLHHSGCQFQDLPSGMSDDPSWMKYVLKTKSLCVERVLAVIEQRNRPQVTVGNQRKECVDLISQKFFARKMF